MKRFWAFIAACLFLLLTACGGSTSTTEPVWQAELPNTGITVQVSGCTLEEKTASYWANPGAAGEPQSIMELYATDSAPLLEIAAPKAQVDIQFVQPVAGGMAAYDLALPVLDYLCPERIWFGRIICHSIHRKSYKKAHPNRVLLPAFGQWHILSGCAFCFFILLAFYAVSLSEPYFSW